MPGTPYHGKTGVVYISTTGSGNATPLILVSEWSLDKSVDTVETTAMGDPNKTYVQGLPDLSGNLKAFFDSGTDQLFDASESTDGCKLYLYPTSLAPTIYHYGPAWLSASISQTVSGAVELTASFKAKGAWGRYP
jgi:hypothetical protein